MKTSAGILNDSGMAVYVEVDEGDPRNQNPQQNLEPSEEIEVYVVAQEDIKEFFLREQKKGVHIAANLWYLFVLKDIIG